MKISVKILFGEERPFEVSREMSVFELKAMVTEQCNIPLSKQKLLLNGRALVDDKKLGEYDIQEGTKLNVFVCQTKTSEKPTPQSLHDVLYEKLKMFWDEEDAKKVVDEFLRTMNEKLYALSLDDIERLATEMMEEEEAAEAAEAAEAIDGSASPDSPVEVVTGMDTDSQSTKNDDARAKDSAEASGQGNINK